MPEHPLDRIIRESNAKVTASPPPAAPPRHATFDRNGALTMGRIKIAYRGFGIRPLFRRKPIAIGKTRLYTWGPVALFIAPKPCDTGTRTEPCRGCPDCRAITTDLPH